MENNKPRVLIFAPLCYPPTGSEAIVTSKLVLGMIDSGWHVKVVSQADFGHFYPCSDNDYWKLVTSVSKNIIGINNIRLFSRIVGTTLTKRLRTFSWIIKAVYDGFTELRSYKYDLIMSRATPHYGHLPALIVSRFFKIPWIANWSDPIPIKIAPPPYGEGINSKISLFLKLYSRAVYRYADWHTFPCERLMKYYWKMAPEIISNSSVIPHIALSRFCIHQEQNNDVFSLCHTGSVANRDLSIFFDGLKCFIKEFRPSKKVQVIFIGDPVDEIRSNILKAGVSGIVQAEAPNTYEETQLKAAHSSVLIVIEAQCDEGIFFPSKFVDFVQTGRPILAVSPIVGTLCDLLNTHGGGIAVDNRSSNEIASALNKLYNEWEKDSLMLNFGSIKLLKYFRDDTVISKYSNLIFRLQGR